MVTLEGKDRYIEEHLVKLQPDTLRFMVADLHAEAERLRVQLAGCGVAAMCNTRQSRSQQKCVEGDYGWSQSYQDVVNAVSREIRFRDALERIGNILETVPAIELRPEDESDLANSQQALFEIGIIKEQALSS